MATATKDCTLSITAVNPLAITSPATLPDGVQGQAYATQLDAAGGVTPYTWAVVAGVLPAGLALDPTTGAITGTPSEGGVFSFTVQVTDARG